MTFALSNESSPLNLGERQRGVSGSKFEIGPSTGSGTSFDKWIDWHRYRPSPRDDKQVENSFGIEMVSGTVNTKVSCAQRANKSTPDERII